MSEFNVTLKYTKPIQIGQPNQSFAIDVEPVGPTKKVKITVILGCGSTQADLLDSADETIKKVSFKAGAKVENMVLVTVPTPGKKSWHTGTFPKEVPVSITFDGFSSNTPPGEAEVIVLVQTWTDNKWSDPPEQHLKKLKKEVVEPEKQAVHYFIANPEFILHAGQKEVTLSFLATGYDYAVLLRNNEEVASWKSPFPAGPQDKSIAASYKDKPSITSVYRLHLKKPDTDSFDDRSITVQVISAGWNQITLPQGSPIRLFVANDFSGSGADRLYGIFRDEEDHYALYSSATGIDTWREEAGQVPPGMEMSPGVYYKNKLWLIGGRSVGTELKAASQVWCYESDTSGNRNWVKKVEFPQNMRSRVGHACVVFPRKVQGAMEEEVWIIGGYNKSVSPYALNDVWRFREDGSGTQLQWEPLGNSSWNPRLNPAAAVYKDGQNGYEVWIYGGSAKPQSAGLTDFWSTNDGKTWVDMSKKDLPVPIMPDPGVPLGATLLSYFRSGSSGVPQSARLFMLGSFKETRLESGKDVGNRIFSFVFEWHRGTSYWEANPVFNGWQQFQGQNFYMQAVVFNSFLFCWSLPDDPKFKGTLNILVSR